MILAPIKLGQNNDILDYTNQIKEVTDYYSELEKAIIKYNDAVRHNDSKNIKYYQDNFKELFALDGKEANRLKVLKNYLDKATIDQKINNTNGLEQIATQYYQNFDIFKVDPLNSNAKNQMESLMAAMKSIDADYAKNVEEYANAQDFSIKRTVNNLKNKKFVLKGTASAEKRASKVSKEYNNNLKKQAIQAKASNAIADVLNF